MRKKRNERKTEILAVLSKHDGWIRPTSLKWNHRIRLSYAGIYVTLKRLAKWELVQSSRSATGKLLYRITTKGRERLAWLLSNSEP